MITDSMYTLILLLIIFYVLHETKYTTQESNKWIGGPTSHVPKPMSRWSYNV